MPLHHSFAGILLLLQRLLSDMRLSLRGSDASRRLLEAVCPLMGLGKH